jgi:curved DNA-binding protein CbpA
MNEPNDYYVLMGVDPSADLDTIRTAYRTRKEAASGEDAKNLNKAWNVLSDPYQRGRYDEQRAESGNGEADVDLTAADDQPSTNGNGAAAPSSPPSKGRQSARKPREVPPPTLTLPAGVKLADRRRRLMAMVTDLFVLLLLYAALTAIGHAVANSQHPGAYSQIDHYTKVVDDANKAKSSAKSDLDKAKATNDQKKIADAQKTYDEKSSDYTAANKQLTHYQDLVSPIQNLFVAIFFVVGMAYLIVPSVLTGRTFGKRMQHLKVVREDGSPLHAWDSMVRYGSVVIITYLLTTLLGPLGLLLGPAIVLFAVTRWMSNRNFQGMHDRFAHTIVIDDGTSTGS